MHNNIFVKEGNAVAQPDGLAHWLSIQVMHAVHDVHAVHTKHGHERL